MAWIEVALAKLRGLFYENKDIDDRGLNLRVANYREKALRAGTVHRDGK